MPTPRPTQPSKRPLSRQVRVALRRAAGCHSVPVPSNGGTEPPWASPQAASAATWRPTPTAARMRPYCRGSAATEAAEPRSAKSPEASARACTIRRPRTRLCAGATTAFTAPTTPPDSSGVASEASTPAASQPFVGTGAAPGAAASSARAQASSAACTATRRAVRRLAVAKSGSPHCKEKLLMENSALKVPATTRAALSAIATWRAKTRRRPRCFTGAPVSAPTLPLPKLKRTSNSTPFGASKAPPRLARTAETRPICARTKRMQ
mmetsp:Transcript_20213/g.45936  ORF Transcript_20213/g.45936 Transcript_20213/m.45936 type:complete len:265 (+) Transcript_20213:160-954(+)